MEITLCARPWAQLPPGDSGGFIFSLLSHPDLPKRGVVFFFLTAESVPIVGEGEAGVAVAFGWMMLQILGKKELQVFKDMGQKAAVGM